MSITKRVVQIGCPEPVHVQDGKAVIGQLSGPILKCIGSQSQNTCVLDTVGFNVASKKDIHAVIHGRYVHEVAVAVGNQVSAILVWS